MGFLQSDVRHGNRDGEIHLKPAGRAITVISPVQAAAALSAAAAQDSPVILLSAPDAASSVGPAWFLSLIDIATTGHPDVAVTPILDCGNAPGYTLAALRLGIRAICFTGANVKQIRDITAQYGAMLLTERPESLDLEAIEASGGDIEAACATWLNESPED